MDTIERFMGKVKKTDSCWVWTAYIDKLGYGQFKLNGKMDKAHRAAYILFKGDIPEGMCVLHNCPGGDDRSCVNPDHLWLGTHSDNMKDKVNKGTQHHPTGSINGKAKVSESQIQEIRSLRESGWTLNELSIKYGVYDTAIDKICRFKTWKHIKLKEMS